MATLISNDQKILAALIEKSKPVYETNFRIGGTESSIQPVYCVPHKYLKFNVKNGRYAAERMAKERELGYSLDVSKPEHEMLIRQILKDENPERWLTLKDDIAKERQKEPAIITTEGHVVNGNRRMAILKELYEEKHRDIHETLDCILLPDDISEKALWRIEAGIQLSQPTQLEYGPINNLLKLSEGIEAGLTTGDMEAVLIGMNAREIEKDLERLKLIDSFLTFHNQDVVLEAEYMNLQRQGLHEYFINLQNDINRWKKNKVNPHYIGQRIKTAFNVMQIVGTPGIRFSQSEFRKLKDIYDDSEASHALEVAVNKAISALNSDDSESAGLTVETRKEIRNAWADAREIIDIKQEKDHPLRLANTARLALDQIDPDKDSFADDEVGRQLRRIGEKLEKLIKAHESAESAESKNGRRK